MKFCEDFLNYFNLLAFNAFRHAVESSTPSFSFFTLTVWNAYLKKETYLKPHANLYVNCHLLKFQNILQFSMEYTLITLSHYFVVFFRLDQDTMHKLQSLEVNSKRNCQNRSTLL